MGFYIDIHTHQPTLSHPAPEGAGVHPWDAQKKTINEAELRSATLIGEIGLDYACTVDRVLQKDIFCRQLSLAQQYSKPVVLHCVRAFEDVMRCLSQYHLRAVIFHGFIGSRQQAEQAVKRGYFLSFGEGAFRSPRTLDAMRHIPLSHLFAETDESPMPIEKIYEMIARERGISIEDLQQQIEENYNNIFLQYNEQ